MVLESLTAGVACVRHPNKKIEFVWDSPQSATGVDILFCSMCIIKGTIPCKPIELVDIEEFLQAQKLACESKGWSEIPEVAAKLEGRIKSQEQFISKQSAVEVQALIDKLHRLEERTTRMFKQFREAINTELQYREAEYTSSTNALKEAINDSFAPSLLANYQNFQLLLQSFNATSTHQGLTQLLQALATDSRNRKESLKEVKVRVSAIEQLEQQEISVKKDCLSTLDSTVSSIESHINMNISNLHELLYSQPQFSPRITGSHLLDKVGCSSLHIDSARRSPSFHTEQNPSHNVSFFLNQSLATLQDRVLAEIKIGDIRKVVCSSTFPSGHSRAIAAICEYQPGKVATAGEDNLIRLWDLNEMECIECLRGHSQGIRDLIALPNGHVVSASYDKTIKVWNTAVKSMSNAVATAAIGNSQVQSVQLSRTLKGHLSGVICLLYLTNNLLASGSSDYTIKIWDLHTGEAMRTISGHLGEVLCLAQPYKILLQRKSADFPSDSQCLVSGASDNHIVVWRLNRKKHKADSVRKLIGHKDFVSSLVILPDDSTLVSASYDKTIILWNFHIGSIIAKYDAHSSFITKISLYSNRTLISSSTDGTLKFWDLSIHSCIHTLEGHNGPANNFAVLNDHSVWSVGVDKHIHVWD